MNSCGLGIGHSNWGWGGGGDSSVHHCIFVICNIVDCMMTLCLYNCEHGSSTCLFQ